MKGIQKSIFWAICAWSTALTAGWFAPRYTGEKKAALSELQPKPTLSPLLTKEAAARREYKKKSESKPEPTAEDVAFVTSLIKEATYLDDSDKPLTQSQAHFTIPAVQDKMFQLAGIAEHEAIIKSALAREAEYINGYAVFYTAIPGLRLFQDVARKLYKKAIGKEGALASGKKAFQFIRYEHNSPLYGQYKDVTDFLLQEIKKEGIPDDNMVNVKTILVSTNLALLGNIGFTGESTYYYFNTPQSWATPNPAWLEASIKSFGFSPEFTAELMELASSIKTERGDIFQFFIPSSTQPPIQRGTLVDRIGYLSWRQGIPFDINFINQLFVGKGKFRDALTFSRRDAVYHDEIIKTIDKFKAKYKAGDPTTVERVEELLRNVRSGDFYLAPFLYLYRSDIQSLPYANYAQARLIITNNMLLNPNSGILIFRYSTLEAKREKIYKEKLNAIVDRMIKERDARLKKEARQKNNEAHA